MHDLTGETSNGSVAFVTATPYASNTKVSDARCDGYDLPYARSAELLPLRRTLPGRNVQQLDEADSGRPQAVLYAIAQRLKSASSCAHAMLEAAEAQDPFELAQSGFGLCDEIRALWQLRQAREPEWGAAINFLQAALGQEEFERFSFDQCHAIIRVIDEIIGGGLVDESDVTKVRIILRKAGFDPWKCISSSA